MGGRKSKIVRNSMYYSESDFTFECLVGSDYIRQDMNQTVLLFQVDRNKSETLDLYGESVGEESISYKEPVELNVIFSLDSANNKAYDKDKNLGRYLQVGNLNFNVYNKELTDNKVDISYGDYIGVQVTPDQMEYFVVTNDGRINFDNKHTMYGYKSYYRSISAVPCDRSEFNGV